jgi:hypothetical protein
MQSARNLVSNHMLKQSSEKYSCTIMAQQVEGSGDTCF